MWNVCSYVEPSLKYANFLYGCKKLSYLTITYRAFHEYFKIGPTFCTYCMSAVIGKKQTLSNFVRFSHFYFNIPPLSYSILMSIHYLF